MNDGSPNNLEFYDSPISANDYLKHPITHGEERMCAEVRATGGPVLDIGCGAGRLFDLVMHIDGGSVGIDYASSPLRVLAARQPGARLIQANVTALPFEPGSFGAVLMGYHLIESVLPRDLRYRAVAEAARVVAPYGIVILTRHLRRSYHPFAQLTAFAKRRVTEFGDLVGPARSVDPEESRSEFRMHVLSMREMAGLTKEAGLVCMERWDHATGQHPGHGAVAIAERYRMRCGESL